MESKKLDGLNEKASERLELETIDFATPLLTGEEIPQRLVRAAKLKEQATKLIEQAKVKAKVFLAVFEMWAERAATDKDRLLVDFGDGRGTAGRDGETIVERGWQAVFADSMQGFIIALCDATRDKSFNDVAFKNVKYLKGVQKSGQDEIGTYFADVKIVGVDNAGLMKQLVQLLVKAGARAYNGDDVGATGLVAHILTLYPEIGRDAIAGVVQARVWSNAAREGRKLAKKLEEEEKTALLQKRGEKFVEEQSLANVAKAMAATRHNGVAKGDSTGMPTAGLAS